MARRIFPILFKAAPDHSALVNKFQISYIQKVSNHKFIDSVEHNRSEAL